MSYQQQQPQVVVVQQRDPLMGCCLGAVLVPPVLLFLLVFLVVPITGRIKSKVGEQMKQQTNQPTQKQPNQQADQQTQKQLRNVALPKHRVEIVQEIPELKRSVKVHYDDYAIPSEDQIRAVAYRIYDPHFRRHFVEHYLPGKDKPFATSHFEPPDATNPQVRLNSFGR